VDEDTRIQVLDNMSFLPRADKEQRGAFIRDERTLVVWTDNFDDIVPVFEEFEEKLMGLVWRERPRYQNGELVTGSKAGSEIALPTLLKHDKEAAQFSKEQEEVDPRIARADERKGKWWNWKLADPKKPEPVQDIEGAPVRRQTRLFASVYSGLAVALCLFFIGSGASLLLQESMLDGKYQRFALLAVAPFLFCIALFFSLQIVGQLTCIFGPVAHYHQNSKYYSAVRPGPNKAIDANLPHLTIEMPVYKESLKETIAPSVYSLKTAMQTYARQGGTSAILMHDDGLQIISEEDRAERIQFYADHNIAWVARPKHDSSEGGFKRAGRFKKASNMNYGLALSLKMEKHLAALIEAGEDDIPDGQCLEDRALEMAVEETYQETGGKWRPWACNGRSMRLGDVILIVDSDTIVPEDCFRDAARELAESPEVAIIQHESEVMQVAHHYFENGISYFTRRVNKSISMVCANGEVAAFVGHNAFLRWSAIQDASFVDPIDGVRKIWSENNVSEDFDMALRLLLKGYITRWATYSNGGFKEGVSLTPDDELNRWEKYSFGCNELIFNPMKDWWRKGPITEQLRMFVWSPAPLHYKISMLAYMFSYCECLLSPLMRFYADFAPQMVSPSRSCSPS
jgi:cellulose synthase/poly-beta-1,6-N-acetylglucosamine synthase-like glycosyltransferase